MCRFLVSNFDGGSWCETLVVLLSRGELLYVFLIACALIFYKLDFPRQISSLLMSAARSNRLLARNILRFLYTLRKFMRLLRSIAGHLVRISRRLEKLAALIQENERALALVSFIFAATLALIAIILSRLIMLFLGLMI